MPKAILECWCWLQVLRRGWMSPSMCRCRCQKWRQDWNGHFDGGLQDICWERQKCQKLPTIERNMVIYAPIVVSTLIITTMTSMCKDTYPSTTKQGTNLKVSPTQRFKMTGTSIPEDQDELKIQPHTAMSAPSDVKGCLKQLPQSKPISNSLCFL